jgi:galactose mutarotase-like enzyme
MHYGAEHTHGARVSDAWTYRGLRAAIMENEELRVVVLADKGGDLASVSHKPTDTELLWRNPNGVRDPRWYQPTTGGANALWLDGYEGGWQSVFPNGGGAATVHGAELGIHGESALLPWDMAVLEQGPERVRVSLRVRLARTPFVAERTLSLAAGAPVLTVEETITNNGRQAFPVSYGQHITFGAPFLDDSCILDLPGATVRTQAVDYVDNHRLQSGAHGQWPFVAGRDGAPVDLRTIPTIAAGSEDMAYFEQMPAGWYALTNRNRRLSLVVEYPVELYRYLWYWQVFGGGTGYPWYGRNYNIGLEPFTSATNGGLASALADGSAVPLGPGESLHSRLRLTAIRSEWGVTDVDSDGSIVLRSARNESSPGGAATSVGFVAGA